MSAESYSWHGSRGARKGAIEAPDSAEMESLVAQASKPYSPGRMRDSFGWMAEAACGPGFDTLPVPMAKRICGGCPVTRACLAYALTEDGWVAGVAAGLTETERTRRTERRAV